MPELVLALISIAIALPGAAITAWHVGGTRGPNPDPLEESELARRAALTAADTARASARAANTAELAEFDAEARRILDVLDVPCVCSQVLTHEWDGRTQSYRQRWTVPVHFTACAKHWPATTGAPPRTADQHHQGGPLLTPAARVNAERARYLAEAWARQITGHPPAPQTRELPSGVTFEPYPARRTPGGVPYRAPATITTYGVPVNCTCVPAHAHAALANTHVVHRMDCATNRGPHAAEWRPVRDNG